jgi:hypothetical protein
LTFYDISPRGLHLPATLKTACVAERCQLTAQAGKTPAASLPQADICNRRQGGYHSGQLQIVVLF